jgi:hypothetical protein
MPNGAYEKRLFVLGRAIDELQCRGVLLLVGRDRLCGALPLRVDCSPCLCQRRLDAVELRGGVIFRFPTRLIRIGIYVDLEIRRAVAPFRSPEMNTRRRPVTRFTLVAAPPWPA